MPTLYFFTQLFEPYPKSFTRIAGFEMTIRKKFGRLFRASGWYPTCKEVKFCLIYRSSATCHCRASLHHLCFYFRSDLVKSRHFLPVFHIPQARWHIPTTWIKCKCVFKAYEMFLTKSKYSKTQAANIIFHYMSRFRKANATNLHFQRPFQNHRFP